MTTSMPQNDSVTLTQVVLEVRVRPAGWGALVYESFLFINQQAAVEALPIIVEEMKGVEVDHYWIGREYIHMAAESADVLFDSPDEDMIFNADGTQRKPNDSVMADLPF